LNKSISENEDVPEANLDNFVQSNQSNNLGAEIEQC